MPTIEDIISDEIRREGGSKMTDDPEDRGGRTQYGISEKANPEAWTDNKVTEEEARAIYEAKYIKAPGFDKIADFHLRSNLVDFGVTSGPHLAIMKLQEILHVEVDGHLGPLTLAAVNQTHPEAINNLLVGKRVVMIGRLVQKYPADIKKLVGWLSRAVDFL